MGLAVGLLHFTSPPVVGGVETVLGHHARLMADAGHAVRMITGRGGRPDPRVELVRVPLADGRHPAVRGVQRALDAGAVPPAFGRLVEALARDLREATAGLDVVIAHNACSLNVNIPLTAALRRLVEERAIRRLVAWNHDVAAASDRYRARLHPGYPWDLFRQPWPGTLAVTISEARRMELAAATGMPAGEIRVVPNGIDRGRFLGLAPATLGLIDALDLRAAAPVLLTPARVMPRKNLELAVRVVAELRRSGEDARLLLTGAPDAQDPGSRDQLDALRTLARAGGGEPACRRGRPPAGGRAAGLAFPAGRRGPVPGRRCPVPAEPRGGLRAAGPGGGRVPPAGDLRGHPGAAGAGGRRRHVRRPGRATRPRSPRWSGGGWTRIPAYRLAARSRASFDWDAVFETRIRPLLEEAAG